MKLALILPYIITVVSGFRQPAARRIPDNDNIEYSHGPGFTCPRDANRRNGCLTQHQVGSILSRWPLIFDSLYSGQTLQRLINCTVTEDFTVFDGTIQTVFGIPLLTTSRASLIASSQNNYDTRNSGPSAASGRFSEVFSFFDCDHIAFRWVYNSVTTGITNCTHTVQTKAGIPIQFYGTDLLTVKPGTQLIQSAVTSGDWLADWYVVEADFTGAPICPTTHPANEVC